MPSIWFGQPGTACYIVYFIFSTLLRLPWYLVSYLPRQRRPNLSGTYRQAVCRFLVQSFLDLAAMIELKQPVNLEPGKENVRFVVIPPAANNIYAGILSCDTNITPTTIGAGWFPEPFVSSSAHKGRRVILHLHGGAYLLGSARDLDFGHAVKSLVHGFSSDRETEVWAFCPEYRLSCHPGNRFPAAFQDAVTAYAHLMHTLKVPPHEIILSGVSAGAHLALCLLRYIVSHRDLFLNEDPAGCLLWSPWPDMVGGASTGMGERENGGYYGGGGVSKPAFGERK